MSQPDDPAARGAPAAPHSGWHQALDRLPAQAFVMCLARRSFDYLNDAMLASCQRVGQDRRALARPDAALSIVHPDDRAAGAAHLEEAAGWPDDHLARYALRLPAAGGGWEWVTMCERVYRRDAAGAATHLLGVGHAGSLGSREEAAFVAERRHIDRLQATVALQQEIATSGLSPPALMSLIARRAAEHCRSRGAFVCLEGGDGLTVAAADAPHRAYVGRAMDRERSLAGRCVLEGRTLLSRDTARDPYADRRLVAAVGARTLVATPLRGRGGIIGALSVFSGEVDGIDPLQVRCLELVANLLAAALEQADALAAKERAIGELRAAQAALRAAHARAEQSARARADFLASMSHELRTPLGGIMGMTELVMDTPLQPEQRRYLQVAHSSGGMLMDIINDVLDLSKIEAGRLEVERAPVALAALVEAQLRLLEARASARGLALHAYVDPRIGSGLISDRGRLGQVLINLLGNAIKFTEGGQVSVRARLVGAGEPGCEVRIEVADTGIGIAPAAQARLFTPFSQAEAGTARRYGGTGLGLSISRRLAALLGGEIGLTSELGRGSTFWLRLPAPRLAPQPAAAPRARARLVVASSWPQQAADWADYGRHLGLSVGPPGRAPQGPPGAGEGEAWVLGDLAAAEAAAAGHAAAPAGRWLVVGDARRLRTATLPAGAARLALPLCLAELAAALAPVATLPAAPRGPAARRAARVLVVDDNAVNQMVAAAMLAQLGYRSEPAASGAEAVAMQRRGRYDLILMDCHMPQMDGFDATCAIRAEPGAGGQPPIIALTASALPGDRERCLARGMNDFLVKPLSKASLAATLGRWLGAPPQGGP